MTITIPSTPPDCDLIEVVRQADVEVEDWKDLALITHFLWGAYQGARTTIPVDGSITVDNEGLQVYRRSWSRVSRPMGGAPAEVLILYDLVATGGSGQWSIVIDRLEADGTLTQIGTTSAPLSDPIAVSLSWADVLEGGTLGSARQPLQTTFRFDVDDSASPAEVHRIQKIEEPTTTASDFT